MGAFYSLLVERNPDVFKVGATHQTAVARAAQYTNANNLRQEAVVFAYVECDNPFEFEGRVLDLFAANRIDTSELVRLSRRQMESLFRMLELSGAKVVFAEDITQYKKPIGQPLKYSSRYIQVRKFILRQVKRTGAIPTFTEVKKSLDLLESTASHYRSKVIRELNSLQ
jgi:hypothetical protein